MRKLLTILLATFLIFAVAGPSMAADRDMWANVYKLTSLGEEPMDNKITSGITFVVLKTTTGAVETLTEYGDDGATSLTNPITTTKFADATVMKAAGVLSFRVDPTAADDESVDLLVTDTAGGYTVFVEDFNRYDHTIVIDERANVQHHGAVYIGSSVAETDTGIDFDYDTMIHDVILEVLVVDAGETVDIGLGEATPAETNGDANGFRTLVSVDTGTEGFPSDTAVITGGTNIDYTPVTTYGALLVTAITGSDAVATNGGKSWIGHVVTGANAVSLTHTGSAGSNTTVAIIHYFFTRMR